MQYFERKKNTARPTRTERHIERQRKSKCQIENGCKQETKRLGAHTISCELMRTRFHFTSKNFKAARSYTDYTFFMDVHFTEPKYQNLVLLEFFSYFNKIDFQYKKICNVSP